MPAEPRRPDGFDASPPLAAPPALAQAGSPAQSPVLTSAQRLFFLDWLRIGAFVLLVVYHVGMYYVSWPFHVKSPNAGAAIEPFMRLSSPWRMSLLFLVSGAATAFMFARAGVAGWPAQALPPADSREPVASRGPVAAALLRERARRLLLPLAFGMLVVVPPQSYFEVVQRFGFTGSYVEFMVLYLRGHGGFCDASRGCLILPTWNHLWFLPYLFVYTALYWAFLRLWPGAVAALARGLAPVLRGARLLWLPMLVVAALRVFLAPRFPVTGALVDDWFSHAQYAFMFTMGALLARNGSLWDRFVELRWPAALLAVGGWMVFAGVAYSERASAMLLAWGIDPRICRATAAAVEQWAAIAALLGFARRWLDFDHPWREYLTQSVFPVYVFHQTLIVVFAMALAPARMAPAFEGPLLILMTLGASLALAEICRNAPGLRRWVGYESDMKLRFSTLFR